MKTGSLAHGIIYFLQLKDGARYKEILVNFPNIEGSSIMTYMRRDGLVCKESPAQTSRYLITEKGKEQLQLHPPYTKEMFWDSIRHKFFPYNPDRLNDVYPNKFMWEMTQDEIVQTLGFLPHVMGAPC